MTVEEVQDQLAAPIAGDAPIIELTESAVETVGGLRGDEPEPESLGLRIEITGSSGSEYTYDLSFDELDACEETDTVVDCDGVPVIIPGNTVDRLRGSVLDMPRVAAQGGLVIRNPNVPNPLEGIELDLQGSLAEKVTQLLEQQINPSLAAHGGFATLLGIDETDNVFVTLGGGCQGCSMSRMTITEGIQSTMKAAIPEVNDVVDATDHSAGENPFYT